MIRADPTRARAAVLDAHLRSVDLALAGIAHSLTVLAATTLTGPGVGYRRADLRRRADDLLEVRTRLTFARDMHAAMADTRPVHPA